MKKILLAVCATLLGSIAVAHHSGAMFDHTKTVTLRGTVKEFQYTNPHSWLQVLVMGADLYRGQQNLEPYIAPSGAKSLPAAIYRDPTLGGAAHTTRVLGAVRPPQAVETAGGLLVGCALEVEVEAM